LLFVESSAVTKRLHELHLSPLTIRGIEDLFEIHKRLFQDIYDWAGKKRVVEISKDGKQFFLTSYFDKALKFIDQMIVEFKTIPIDNKKELSLKLAEILDHVNFLHPFREGNGRAQREFIRLLALDKGFTLNLNPPDNKNVFDRYMKGTVDSDVNILADLIFELLESNRDLNRPE
jgi:cell filamentation protein